MGNLLIFLHILWMLTCCSTTSNFRSLFENEDCIEGMLTVDDTGSVFIKTGSKTHIAYGGIKSSEIEKGSTHLLNNLNNERLKSKSPTSEVNELATYNKIDVEYTLVEEKGPPHDRTFVVRLDLGSEKYYAADKSIKKAKSAAASLALGQTRFSVPIKNAKEGLVPVEKLTPTVQLNNIAAKLGLKIEYVNELPEEQKKVNFKEEKYISNANYYVVDNGKGGYLNTANNSINSTMKTTKVPTEVSRDSQGPFKVRVYVGENSYVGTGVTIQAARHDAAEKALVELKTLSVSDVQKCLEDGKVCNKISIKNPISLMYETATKRGLSVSCDVTDESGPGHKRQFTTTCNCGELTTSGDGKSKKVSKRAAAEKMLKLLDLDEKISAGDSIIVNTERNSKKKKNKIKKGVIQNAKLGIIDTVKSTFNMITGVEFTDENIESGPVSNRQNLLQLGKNIGLDIKLSTFKLDDFYSTLVTLNSEPSYVCHNKDIDSHTSVENAALSALEFIKAVGLDNILIPLKETGYSKPRINIKTKINVGFHKEEL